MILPQGNPPAVHTDLRAPPHRSWISWPIARCFQRYKNPCGTGLVPGVQVPSRSWKYGNVGASTSLLSVIPESGTWPGQPGHNSQLFQTLPSTTHNPPSQHSKVTVSCLWQMELCWHNLPNIRLQSKNGKERKCGRNTPKELLFREGRSSCFTHTSH